MPNKNAKATKQNSDAATKNTTKKPPESRLKRLLGTVFNTEQNLTGVLQLIAIIALIIVAVFAVFHNIAAKGFIYDFLAFMVDKDRVRAWVNDMGVFAPLGFILLQILQTVVSPIPGNVVGFAGGLLFGWWGVLLSVIGGTIGYWIVLVLVRKLGRSFVEKLISKNLLDKFDYLASERGSLIFFLIFLIPALPDDVVMIIAGLTKLPIGLLLFMAAVGRFPSVVVTNQLGSSLAEKDIPQLIFLVAISLVVVGLCLWKRDAIMNFGKKQQEKLKQAAKNQQEKLKPKKS